MAATADDLRRNIEPGSIPFGERQRLEGNLPQLGQAPGPAAIQTPLDSELGIPSNPLDSLLGGDIPVAPDEVTAGLDAGPGPGSVASGPPDSRVERLRMVASQARSPVLRELARRALLSTVRTRRGR